MRDIKKWSYENFRNERVIKVGLVNDYFIKGVQFENLIIVINMIFEVYTDIDLKNNIKY